jgi:hypothetical protein
VFSAIDSAHLLFLAHNYLGACNEFLSYFGELRAFKAIKQVRAQRTVKINLQTRYYCRQNKFGLFESKYDNVSTRAGMNRQAGYTLWRWRCADMFLKFLQDFNDCWTSRKCDQLFQSQRVKTRNTPCATLVPDYFSLRLPNHRRERPSKLPGC